MTVSHSERDGNFHISSSLILKFHYKLVKKPFKVLDGSRSLPRILKKEAFEQRRNISNKCNIPNSTFTVMSTRAHTKTI